MLAYLRCLGPAVAHSYGPTRLSSTPELSYARSCLIAGVQPVYSLQRSRTLSSSQSRPTALPCYRDLAPSQSRATGVLQNRAPALLCNTATLTFASVLMHYYDPTLLPSCTSVFLHVVITRIGTPAFFAPAHSASCNLKLLILCGHISSRCRAPALS